MATSPTLEATPRRPDPPNAKKPRLESQSQTPIRPSEESSDSGDSVSFRLFDSWKTIFVCF